MKKENVCNPRAPVRLTTHLEDEAMS